MLFYIKQYKKTTYFTIDKMNTSLIRKIIASDLPRKEQDLLILLVAEYNTNDQKKKELNAYYEEEESSKSESECESESESDRDCKNESVEDDFDSAVRAQYEARHRPILSGSELAAHVSAEKSISHDHSKVWGLQFPSSSIWGNWVYSYSKEDEAQ